MTTIRLNAETVEKIRNAEGRVVLCDENGQPVRTCLMFRPDSLDQEPELTEGEWDRRAKETETYTTAQVLETLRRLGNP